jgi:hypothetical protein
VSTTWPGKPTRENREIEIFLRSYPRLPHGMSMKVETQREKPDFIVVDATGRHRLGVEVTSVYLDDRSVPDRHMLPRQGVSPGPSPIEYDGDAIDQYKTRLIDAIRDKIEKAREGYDTSHPLVLSVYVNEYESIFLTQADLREMVRDHEAVLRDVSPFSEIVLVELADGEIWSIRPGGVVTTATGAH